MNIFAVLDGRAYELTRENFIYRTRKMFPYYQNPRIYRTPYFAICPACGNPIQIINLFGAQYIEEKTERVTLHGRHIKRDIEGLPHYNQANYEGCPLHNPVAFRIVEIRNNEIVNEEIRELVENNRTKIAFDIREITGVLLKNDRINRVIDDYIDARDYCYTHTNKYNIPYSILYTREAINLFGQRIDTSEIGEKISMAIHEKSSCFDVESGRIIKKVDEFVTLNLIVANHTINKSKQYMTISIEERNKDNCCSIFEERFEMKQYIYDKKCGDK